MERPERLYPFVYLSARESGGQTLHAPFWRVTGAATWRTDDPEKARLYRTLKPLGPLYFPAFLTPRSVHDDNLTMRYALLDSPPPEEPDVAAPLLPGIVDPGPLPEMARLTWLAYLDRVADVTGVALEFAPSEVAYAAVPFVARPGAWEDGVLGLRFPDAFFGRSSA